MAATAWGLFAYQITIALAMAAATSPPADFLRTIRQPESVVLIAQEFTDSLNSYWSECSIRLWLIAASISSHALANNWPEISVTKTPV